MADEDVLLRCVACQAEFLWSSRDQEFYRERNCSSARAVAARAEPRGRTAPRVAVPSFRAIVREDEAHTPAQLRLLAVSAIAQVSALVATCAHGAGHAAQQHGRRAVVRRDIRRA